MTKKKFIVLFIIIFNILMILGGWEYYKYSGKTIENAEEIIFIIHIFLLICLNFGAIWLYHYRQRNNFRSMQQIHELINVRLNLLEFSAGHSLDDLLTKMLDEVERLTGSKIGFYHIVESDQETLTLQAWSTSTKKEFCKAEGKGLHYNISKAGVWVDCIHKKAPVIHNSYQSLTHKKGMPEGHAEVVRELVVPILREDKIVAILGVGNKSTDYTQKDIEIVSYLADIAWEIIRKKTINERIGYLAKRYEIMFSHLHTGIIVIDEFNRVEFINESFSMIFDLNKYDSKLIGLNIEEFLPAILPKYRYPQKISELIKHFLQDNADVVNQEIELIDGRILLTDFISINIESRNHGKIFLLRDITKNKSAENEINNQNSILNAIINNSYSIMIFMVNNEFRYINFNQNYRYEMQRNYGKTPEIGMNVLDHINILEDSELMKDTFERVFAGESFTEIKFLPHFNKYYEFHWNQARKPDGEIYAASCFILDVTQRVKISERIKYLNSILAAIRNINQLIVKENDKQRLIQKACNLLIDTRGFKHAIIVLIDEEQKITSYAFASEDKNQLNLISAVLEADIFFSCQKKALKDKMLIAIENIDRDCPECPFETYGDTTGVLVVPLIFGNKIFGIFSIYLEKNYINAPEEQSLFLEVAGDIAYALHKLELEDEKNKAIKALYESEELYKDLFEQSPMGYQSLDEQGNFIVVNQTWLDMLGYQKEEVIGKWFGDFLVDEYKEKFTARFLLFKTLGKIHSEFEMIKKDGSIVYTSFEGRIGHTLSGEFKQTHCTLQDITEKRKAEEALKESERKYSDLYENSPDMHLSVDPETTRIIQCNGTLSKTTGYSKEELINKPLTELYHPHCLEYFRKNLEQFRNTGKIENAELEVLKKNGESMYVLLNSSAVYNKEGKITHSRSIWRDITLQKKLETEEKRLWKILKESLNEIYIFNKDTLKFEFVNDGALRNLGYSLEEIRNLTPVDIKPEYDLNTFRAAIMPILIHEKEILVFETLHKRKDGTLYNVDVHLQLIKYGTEEIFVAIILDITDRKKVEAEIKESEHFIRTVMDNLPIGIAVNSADTSVKFQYINDNFTKFYDVTKDTLSIQDNFWDEVNEDTEFREKIKKRVLDDCASGDPDKMIWENIPIKRKGKPTRYVSARNIPIADNHLMISLVWDVTERKIAESDLEESEKKYRSIVQYLPEAVIIHSQGKILYANPQTLKLIGAESFEQIKNIPAINFVHQDYRTHAIERISRILKNKETAELTEEKFVKLNGEVFDVEVIGVPINYEGKESIQTIIRDISERKKAEQELEEHRFHLEDLVKKRTIDLEDVNKKLEEEISKVREAEEKVKIALVKEQELGELKSRFISITSHEFRTPLTSLLSSVEILEMGGRNYDDDKRNIHYQKIKNNIEFMIKMIDELLYLNRIDSNRIKVSYIKTNLMDFCTELFDSIKGNYNTIEAVIDAKLGKTEFNIDRDLLRKILTNLLVNAFKFNKENGKVNFAVSSMNDKLFFSISDTGIGIPEEEQKNLFEPFTRMSNSQQVKGTGLGLNIVKKSVDQLGGSVTFTSNKNGTVFTVVIPHY